jgi:hypothetical protein
MIYKNWANMHAQDVDHGHKNDMQKVFYMKKHICLILMNMKFLKLIYLKNWMISSLFSL